MDPEERGEHPQDRDKKCVFTLAQLPPLQIIQGRAARVWVSHKIDYAMRGNERGGDEEVQLRRYQTRWAMVPSGTDLLMFTVKTVQTRESQPWTTSLDHLTGPRACVSTASSSAL